MLHYISFGSGSSGNCGYLYTENTGIIIDAGVGIRTIKKYFREYNLKLDHVKHVLITHDHADHVKSVGRLSKDYNLPVYTTQLVHKGIDANWCVRNKIAPELTRIIEKDVEFELDGLHITPFAVPHDSSDNVGYCIRYEDITFVLMTDIGHVTEDIKRNIAKANYLVIEADYEVEMLDSGPYPEHLKNRIRGPFGHMSNYDCALALVENATPKLRHAWLCHLSNENNHPELAAKKIKQILRSHGIVAGNEAGADFKLDVLKRKTPSEIYELTL